MIRGAAVRRVALVLLVVLAGCGGDGSPPARHAAVAAAGTFDVAHRAETFVDTKRPTPANGNAPAAATRTLVTDVWYPARNGQPAAGDGPFPLILFSHGFSASPAAYEPLLRTWASAGYVVAAPAFPLSNGDAPGGPNQNDVPNQPADVSFVLSSVLGLAAGRASQLHGVVDAARVGAAGHSMGAITTMAVAYNTCCADNRIKAAAIMSGTEGVFAGGSYTAPDRPPALFLHGDRDDTIPASSGLLAFAHARPPKFFVTLVGSGHSEPFTGDASRPDVQVVRRATLDFFDRYLKGAPDGVARLRHDAGVAGVASVEAVER